VTDAQKKWLIFALKLAIGVGIVAFLLVQLVTQRGQRLDQLFSRSIGWGFFAGAVGCILVAVMITFVRWFVMVRSQRLTLTFADVLSLSWIGYFFSNFMPSTVGGDLVKAAYLIREQSQKAVAVATVVLDRIIGLYGLFVMGSLTTALLLGSILGDPNIALQAKDVLRTMAWIIWGTTALATACLVIGFTAIFRGWRLIGWLGRLRWVGGALRNIFRSMEFYRDRIGVLLLCVGMSVMVHLMILFGFFCAIQAMDLPEARNPSLRQLAFMDPIGMFVGSVPVAPGGLGQGEGAFKWLFDQMPNLDGGDGVLCMLLFRAGVWTTTIPGFILYLRGRKTVQQLQARAEKLSHLDEQGTSEWSP